MSAYVTDKKTDEIKQKLIDFLNTHLTDPYEQSTGKERDEIAHSEDFKITSQAVSPIIHVFGGDITPTRASAGTKTTFLEEIEHIFYIYYYNQPGHLFTFDNGAQLKNAEQCRKYMQYIKDTIKSNLDQFGEYFHGTTFGMIAQPRLDNVASKWVSFMPVLCRTYCR